MQQHRDAGQPPIQAMSARRALPDRNVTAASLDHAYVAFILYCNPAVPLDTDTAALREAFRAPPKSAGKVFSTFTLFDLIKRLESKELKTWAELALRLGVEPPDQEKGQSTQKIQQYAVRLKRWMHSMHVDAFFDYLIGRPSPYWTDIPSEHIPVSDLERDSVAAEDDMALRALLPQIKPRRGRRKPDEDDSGRSPPPRPSPQPDGFLAEGQANTAEPWTAQPDGRGSVFLFPPVPDASRLNPSAPAAVWGSDIVQTPMTAYPMPQSAITPSTRNAFWADEPKSAITPSKPRPSGRRHGAKAVSSAWRSGGLGPTGKARGRPPINRGANIDGPFSAFPTSETPSFRFPSPTPDSSALTTASNPAPAALVATTAPPVPPVPSAPARSQTQPVPNPGHPQPTQDSAPARPAKKRMLSLQVPERIGGEVRLASPPPPPPPPAVTITIDGQPTEYRTHPATQRLSSTTTTITPQTKPTTATPNGTSQFTNTTTTTTTTSSSREPPPPPPPRNFKFSLDPTDRTNKDETEVLFMTNILQADWFDAHGNPIPPCGVDEAWALTQRVIENLLASAATKEAFLINLAALAGGKVLLNKGSVRITRVEEEGGDGDGDQKGGEGGEEKGESGGRRTRYACAWQLRFGDVVGDWGMEETVAHCRWKKEVEGGKGGEEGGEGLGRDGGGAGGWEKKYREVAGALLERDREIALLKAKILETIRGK